MDRLRRYGCMSMIARRGAVTNGRKRALPKVLSDNPFTTAPFYINPENPARTEANSLRTSDPDRAAQFDKIGDSPVAIWAGDWIPLGTEAAWIDERMDKIQLASALPVFVLYNIPYRDNGSYSGGGATSADAYRTWIGNILTGFAGRPSVIILEPDAVPLLTGLVEPQRSERVTLLNETVIRLRDAGHHVYLDGGHSNWHPAPQMAALLEECGVQNGRGFSLNVSNFRTTGDTITFGDSVNTNLSAAKKYVIDTSRNGVGPHESDYINPPGRALGEQPTATTASVGCDAYFWVKAPGESDGDDGSYQTHSGEDGTATATGTIAPTAGSWWANYGYGLAARSAWGPAAPVSSNAKTATVTSDFTSLDTTKFPGSFGAAIVSGRAQIATDSTYPRVSTGTDSTAVRYDLTESSVFVEVPTVPNIGTGTTSAFLQLEAPAGTGVNSVEVGWQNGSLILRELVNGTYNDLSLAYSLTQHRWWRIRHSSGTVFWETSPDKSSWTVQRQKSPDAAIDLTKVAIALVSGFYGTETSPGVAEFDNLNI
ncbi:hypothetical protein CYG49_01515 [Candidatus Saccharibacteria bacterium]|nr:MAG: hypothetical protein CYG49_01515 [Candidatus Saccharibacteria bacterium]